MNSKTRCLAALKGHQVDRTPVFTLLMSFSQKGLNISYKTFATNGYSMAEAQINIKEKFKIDAITACSDAFRITADLGADMVFPDNQPPFASNTLVKDENDYKRLKRPDVGNSKSRMYDRILGVEEMVKAVGTESLVLGGVGS